MGKASQREITAALNRAWRIPGMYGRNEGGFLYRLARRKGNLVEIGSYMGRTTAIMLQAAAVWGASLTSIDNFTTTQPGIPIPATPAKWRNYLKAAGLEPPELLAMTSTQAAKRYEKPISLLFIDGDHAYRTVRSDLRNWTPKIQVGGYLLLHDMFFHSVNGVCRAVVEWWKEPKPPDRWKCLGLVGYTIAFARGK